MSEQEKIQYPQSERQRRLQSLSFAENSILSRDLPRDTVLKSVSFRMSGSVITTFASGTPLADSLSIFDNLVKRIDVVVDGSRTVKSVRPHLLKMQQLFTTGALGERRSSAGASAALDNFPTVDGGFVYGTTTQVSTVAESILLSFEHVYCLPGMGREETWLNLKGVASAEVRLTCGSFLGLRAFGNTAPVVFSGSTIQIEITTLEAQHVPAEMSFADWKQTTKEIQISSESNDLAIDINRGNLLSGLMIFARDGAAGGATTAAGKLPSNLALTKIGLKVNGQTSIKETNFKQLQSENKSQYGINAPMASNVSLIDGVAHLNLLTSGQIQTALDCRPPLVDNVQLFVDSNNSTNVSYTNPVSVTIMTEEVVAPR